MLKKKNKIHQISQCGRQGATQYPTFSPFLSALSCTSPGVGDVTKGTGDQAECAQRNQTGS